MKVRELTFAYGFSKNIYKKANFPHWMKEIFFAKKKKKMKKRKIIIKVRIKIFQDNKRERNLKAINYQNLLSANQQKFLLFNMHFIFHP